MGGWGEAARKLTRITPTLQKRDLRLRGAELVCESGGLVLECTLLTTGTPRFSEMCLMSGLLYLLHLLPRMEATDTQTHARTCQ